MDERVDWGLVGEDEESLHLKLVELSTIREELLKELDELPNTSEGNVLTEEAALEAKKQILAKLVNLTEQVLEGFAYGLDLSERKLQFDELSPEEEESLIESCLDLHKRRYLCWRDVCRWDRDESELLEAIDLHHVFAAQDAEDDPDMD